MMVPPYQRGGISMIPGSFAPSVSEEPLPMAPAAAPGVRPMRNGAPGQLEQTGQTLDQEGALETHLGNTIGDRVQATMDDADVRNAQTAFLSSANNVVTAYTHSLGKDAIDGLAPAQQALDKAAEDAKAGLTNLVQQHMFSQFVMPRLAGFGKQLNDHQFQQHIQYGTQAFNDSADSYVQQAANDYAGWQRPGGNFARNKGLAIQEAQQAAQLLGQPADSPQALALVKQKTTALAQGVLTRMMDKEQYAEAQQYLDANKDEIDERAYEVLSNAVLEGHQSQKGASLAKQAQQIAMGGDAAQPRITPVAGGSITSTMGAPRADGRTHDGIDIAVPVGTSVRAPANGTVTKVWNDDKFGGGLSMEISYPNGNVEGFAHLAAVNYKPGQQVSQGMTVALTGKSGDATGPVLHWAMKDANGQWVDPRSVGAAPKNPDQFTTPEQFEKGLAYIDGSDATDRVKDIAITKLRSQYGTARELQDQQYQEVKQDALNYYYSHNYSLDGYPSDKRMQLKPQDLDALTQAPKQDDFPKAFEFLSSPKQDQTMANLNKIAGSLTAKTYKELATKVLNLQNEVESFPPANVPHDKFTDALRTSGFGNLVNSKDPADQKQFSRLRTSIEQTATGEQQVLNRKLKPEEWDKIINDTLTQHVFVERGSRIPGVGLTAVPTPYFGNVPFPTLHGRHYSEDEPLAGVSAADLPTAYVMSGGKKVHLADIPAGVRARYETQLVMANANLPAGKQLPITEQSIADAWVAHGMPKQ